MKTLVKKLPGKGKLKEYKMNDRCLFIPLLSIFFFIVYVPVWPDHKAVPGRIILNLTADPAHEISITWRTGPGVKESRVEYMPATPKSDRSLNSGSFDPYKEIKTAAAALEKPGVSPYSKALHYSVTLTGLKPGTLYQYRVGDGTTWSEWCHFRTPGPADEPFTFIYLGDPQDDIESFCSRIFRAAYSAAPSSRFILIGGDLVAEPWLDERWEEFFYAAGWMVRQVPVIAVPGNHCCLRDNGLYVYKSDKPHPLWSAQLTLPRNGPIGLEETAYYIDYQGVRFILLNGNEKLQEQALWLESLLAGCEKNWTIVAIHQPFYSTGKDRDNPVLRDILLPVIDKYTVDLVLQGHDHTYGRTYKLKNGAIVKNNREGTVFVTSVSGPKFYEINEKYRHLMKIIGTDVQLFQLITVKKNVLIYEARTVTNERYDYFELSKAARGGRVIPWPGQTKSQF